jgi:hypothetical protein
MIKTERKRLHIENLRLPIPGGLKHGRTVPDCNAGRCLFALMIQRMTHRGTPLISERLISELLDQLEVIVAGVLAQRVDC